MVLTKEIEEIEIELGRDLTMGVVEEIRQMVAICPNLESIIIVFSKRKEKASKLQSNKLIDSLGSSQLQSS